MDYGNGSLSSAKPKEKGGSSGLAMAIGIVSIIVAVSIAGVFLQGDPTAPESKYTVTCYAGDFPILTAYTNELPFKQPPDNSWRLNDVERPGKPVIVSEAAVCVTKTR